MPRFQARVPDRWWSDAIEISVPCILRYDSDQSITVCIIVIQVIGQYVYHKRDLSYYYTTRQYVARNKLQAVYNLSPKITRTYEFRRLLLSSNV